MICVLSVNRSRKRLTISFVAVLIHSLSGKSLNYHYLLLRKQQVQLGYFDWGLRTEALTKLPNSYWGNVLMQLQKK